jgi:SAM-dependent methyltransferase
MTKTPTDQHQSHAAARFLLRSALGRKLILRLGQQRTADILGDLLMHVSSADRLLDVGAGTCDVAHALQQRGLSVDPFDVVNLSCHEHLRPRIFDGVRLPLPDRSYDVGLLVGVLHHVADPDALLREVARTSRRVFIHEDIFKNTPQKYATYAMDSLTNLEFFGHPHANRDDQAWRATFERLGLKLESARYREFWGAFANGIYVVSPR